MKEKKMERKIVKRIGNLEMDENGIVYKTSRGGFKAPPLPEQYKIPYQNNIKFITGFILFMLKYT